MAGFNPIQLRDKEGQWAESGAGEIRVAERVPTTRLDPTVVTGADEEDEDVKQPDEGWVSFPEGDRLDELRFMMECIANAEPEDGPALHADITRLFIDAGDIVGGTFIRRALGEVLMPGTTLADRQRILEELDRFTRADPAVHGEAMRAAIGAMRPRAPLQRFSPTVWNKGWAAGGREGEDILKRKLRERLHTRGLSP